MDELLDSGTDTPVWQRYRLKIMSLTQQVSLAQKEEKNPRYAVCLQHLLPTSSYYESCKKVCYEVHLPTRTVSKYQKH